MNAQFYDTIKQMLEEGVTHQEIEDMIKAAQEEAEAKKVKDQSIILARECLINAVIAYCKELGLAEDLNATDINELRKSLATIETTIAHFQGLVGANPSTLNIVKLFGDMLKDEEN